MSTAPPEAPQLRPARLDDYERIKQLGLSFGLDLPLEDAWRNLWLGNPLRGRFGDDLPLGWVLETKNGEAIGTMGTVLVPYTFEGNDLVSAVSRAWFVKAQYRSLALLLMDEYLHQPNVDLFINNAVSVPALEAFQQFCRPVPLGEWDCMSYWNTNSARKQLLPEGSQSLNVEALDRFDDRFDAFWKELVRQNPQKLLADRSSPTLAWHYGAALARGRLWVFTACRAGRLIAYGTLTRQDHAFRLPALPHGDAQDAPAMRLVDFQTIEPSLDALPAMLHAALQRCARENVFILENLGRGVPKMRAADLYAPHLKTLSNWKFFYGAARAGLEARLRAAHAWDPSAYDGDASFE